MIKDFREPKFSRHHSPPLLKPQFLVNTFLALNIFCFAPCGEIRPDQMSNFFFPSFFIVTYEALLTENFADSFMGFWGKGAFLFLRALTRR